MTFQRAGQTAPTTVTREGPNCHRVVGPGINALYTDSQIELDTSSGRFTWTRGNPDFSIERQEVETGRITSRSSF